GPDLADEDPVWAHAQRVRDEVGDPDAGAGPRWDALEMHHVRVRENQVVRVFDHDKTLVVGYRGGQGPEQRAFTGARRPAHENARPLAHACFQKRRRVVVHAARDPRRRSTTERDREPIELSDREAGTTDRGDDGIRAASVTHPSIDEGPLERQLAPDTGGDAVRELGDIFGAAKCDTSAL